MKILDVTDNTARLCKELADLLTHSAKQYRPLCGVCHRAPSVQEAQDKLLASREKTVEVCSCKRGRYHIELESSSPTCMRVVHTYQLHAKPAQMEDSYSI